MAALLLPVLALAVALALAAPATALAHGIHVPGWEAPVPSWFVAANVVVVLFVAFAVFASGRRDARRAGDRWRPLPAAVSRLVVNRVTEAAAGALGVLLLGVVVWSGFWGTDQVGWNFSVTFVYITFWIGLALLSAVLGDVFRALNPWRALARAGGWTMRRVSGASLAEPLPYPEPLGRWPAVIALLAWGFFDQAYTGRGIPDAGTEVPLILPATLALAVVLYSLYTFVMMAVFGVEVWLRRGEAFSVVLSMFATVAPLEVRDGRLGLRPWLHATRRWGSGLAGSAPIPLILIALTLYDDLRWRLLETERWATIQNELTLAGLSGSTAARLTGELHVLAIAAAVIAALALAIAATRPPSGSTRRELWRELAGCVVPIALAYTVMHYFAYLVQHSQAQFTYLLSDPLGRGWDLFGGSGYVVDDTGVGPDATWAVLVIALVAGHAGALAVALDRSASLYASRRDAVRGIWPILALISASAIAAALLLI